MGHQKSTLGNLPLPFAHLSILLAPQILYRRSSSIVGRLTLYELLFVPRTYLAGCNVAHALGLAHRHWFLQFFRGAPTGSRMEIIDDPIISGDERFDVRVTGWTGKQCLSFLPPVASCTMIQSKSAFQHPLSPLRSIESMSSYDCDPKRCH